MSIKAHELDQVIKTNSNSDFILLTFALLDPTIHLRMICRMKNSFSSRSRNIFSYWHSQPWPWKKLELLNHFEIVEELRLASCELCSKNVITSWFLVNHSNCGRSNILITFPFQFLGICGWFPWSFLEHWTLKTVNYRNCSPQVISAETPAE